MAHITFRLILLNAFNNPMYCKAVCNRDAFNVFVYIHMAILYLCILWPQKVSGPSISYYIYSKFSIKQRRTV